VPVARDRLAQRISCAKKQYRGGQRGHGLDVSENGTKKAESNGKHGRTSGSIRGLLAHARIS